MFVHARVFVTEKEKTLAYYKIRPFAVNYESVMFYGADPSLYNKTFCGRN